MPDRWSRKLLVAILRKYEVVPYRYPRWRRSTIVANAPDRIINDIVWPEFQQIRAVLDAHLLEVTDRIIEEALHSDGREADVVQGELPLEG